MVPEDQVNSLQLKLSNGNRGYVYPTIVLQTIVLEVAHVLGCYTLSLEIPCLLNLLTPALTSIDLLRMRADWKVLWQDFI